MRQEHPFFKQLQERLEKASSREERIEIVRTAGVSARAEFPVRLRELEEFLLNFNPFVILAAFSFYDLSYLPELGRRMNESDPIDQYHIEIVQALILCHEHIEFKFQSFSPKEFQQLRDLVEYVSILQSCQDYAGFDASLSTNDIQKVELILSARSHTKIVRNWGYEEQTISALTEIFSPLEDSLERALGVRVESLLIMFRALHSESGKRLQEHFSKVKDFMRKDGIENIADAYLKNFPVSSMSKKEILMLYDKEKWPIEEIKVMLLSRSNHFLLPVYAFENSDFLRCYPGVIDSEKLHRILALWTTKPGDLRGEKREHFFLNNPIWTKSMIRVAEEVVFWPVLTLFNGFCFEMFESLISTVPGLKARYSDSRAQFLENRVFQLLRKQVPGAAVFQSNIWIDPATGKKFENDILVIFDSVAVIMELKSGAINPVAQRGGQSITQEIDELLIEPARQAHMFAKFLKENGGRQILDSKHAGQNVIDVSAVHEYFCLSVTLERFGPIGANVHKLQKAGLAKSDVVATPAISLPDFEVVLQILDNPFELLHYLTRRAAFELRHSYIGNELDLLAFYLRNGFVGVEDGVHFVLNELSKELHPYFLERPDLRTVKKPARNLSGWWLAILKQLEISKTPRRFELGCILLDVPTEFQEPFEEQFLQLCNKVKGNKSLSLEELEAIWLPIKSDMVDAVFVAVPVKTELYLDRHLIVERLASQAMDKIEVDRAVVVLVDISLDHWPYSDIYYLDRTQAEGL